MTAHQLPTARSANTGAGCKAATLRQGPNRGPVVGALFGPPPADDDPALGQMLDAMGRGFPVVLEQHLAEALAAIEHRDLA